MLYKHLDLQHLLYKLYRMKKKVGKASEVIHIEKTTYVSKWKSTFELRSLTQEEYVAEVKRSTLL